MLRKLRRASKARSVSARLFLEALEDRALPSTSIPINAHSWTALGPASLNEGGLNSGRITAIAPHPTDPNTLYIGAASGGVWKTVNGGASWVPLTDRQATLMVGAIGIARSNPNVIYVGTGEADLGPSKLALARDNIYYGRGVLRSQDGGATWTLLGQAQFFRRTISAVVVDPTNPNTVYVSVGALATNGLPGNTGVWKSIDGGVNWANTTSGITTTAAFSDLLMDPTNPQVLYAAIGQPQGSTSNSIWKSVNGGASWFLLSNFPTGAVNHLLGRIKLAIAPSSPNILYASATNDGQSGNVGTLLFMAKTTDGGASWFQLTGTPDYLSAGDYGSSLAVFPTNPNVVYAGGFTQPFGSLIRSLDGGATWTDIETGADGTGPHTDHHVGTFDAGDRFLDGNDGGLWRLDNPNPGTLHWADLNSNLNTIQFTGIDLHPSNADIAYGGAQDNSTEVFNNNLVWAAVQGGDGGFVHVDQVTPTTVYHTFYYAGDGFLERSDDGGAHWVSATAGINTADPAHFYPPYVIDPSNHFRLLLGTNRVYQSLDRGNSWAPISAPGVNGWITAADVDSVAAAATDANTVYATAGGFVFVTHNRGASWAATSPLTAPSAAVRFQDVVVDPRNANIVYVVAANFGDATGGGHVWFTSNGGATWTNVSGNLPDLPTYTFALNPSSALRQNDVWYIGTDAGVYYTANFGRVWTPLGAGLPHVQVVDLHYSAALGLLAAGTNGRGMWEIQIPVGTTIAVAGADRGGGPQVSVFDGRSGLPEYAFYAFEKAFTGGVRVAVGDVNGDGVPDIIAAPGPGRPPEVRVFDSRTGAILQDFIAYSIGWQNGVYVASADVNHDGFADIITGVDAGGGPEVRVLSGLDNHAIYDFFAYSSAFPGGVRVAASDVNGDGFADIITGAGPGGGPHVEVFSGLDRSLLRSFYAFPKTFVGGVYVGGGDINGDHFADVIAGAGPGGGPQVVIRNGADNALLASFYAYPISFTGGVRVALADVNGDGRADVVTGAGPGGGPELIVRDAATRSKFSDFDAFPPTFPGGIFVAGPVLGAGGSAGSQAARQAAALPASVLFATASSGPPQAVGAAPVASAIAAAAPADDPDALRLLLRQAQEQAPSWPASAADATETLSWPRRSADSQPLLDALFAGPLALDDWAKAFGIT